MAKQLYKKLEIEDRNNQLFLTMDEAGNRFPLNAML